MGEKLKFSPTPLQGAYIVTPNLLKDNRGEFFRTYCKTEFTEIKFDKEFVQMNHSINYRRGTMRGLHFQSPRAPEEKLIQCIRGSVYDVIVDIRKKSPTFMKYYAINLNPIDKQMIFVPAGCAHGFLTLEDNSELTYSHSQTYNPSEEKGLRFDDPMINIDWPNAIEHISERDSSHPHVGESFKGYDYEM